MKAIYQEKPYCAPCIDIYGLDMVSECKHCMELHRYEVEVLQLGARRSFRKGTGALRRFRLAL